MADARLAGHRRSPTSVLDLIGNTPLVRLKRVGELEGLPCVLAMKMETTNPGGSSKDRPALEMILAAERDGLLRPGGTIVEPTSGNTGVGLAIVAAQRGYRCVFVMTDKVAPEKISLLRAYGAEVVVCPVAVAPEDPQSYYSVAERLTERARTRSGPTSTPTRPTRWPTSRRPGPSCGARPPGGSPTSSPAPARAGRSPATARYLKAQNPAVKIIAADPEGSVFSGGSRPAVPRRGRRRGLLPRGVAARAVRRRHRRSATRRASSPPAGCRQDEGILIGGSGGMAVAAAIRVAKRGRPRRHRRRAQPGLRPRLPLTGVRRRLDGQLRVHPRVRAVRRCGARAPAATRRRCSTSTPARRCARRSSVMQANGISQLPVCKNTPPFAAAEVSGAVDELDADGGDLPRPGRDATRRSRR